MSTAGRGRSKSLIQASHAEGFSTALPYPPIHWLDVFKHVKYREAMSEDACADTRPMLPVFAAGLICSAELVEARSLARTAWQRHGLPRHALLGDEQDMQ